MSHTQINGREGVCCFTICNDVTGMGEEVVMVLDRYATLTDGLSNRKSRSPILEKLYEISRLTPRPPPPAQRELGSLMRL